MTPCFERQNVGKKSGGKGEHASVVSGNCRCGRTYVVSF